MFENKKYTCIIYRMIKNIYDEVKIRVNTTGRDLEHFLILMDCTWAEVGPLFIYLFF